MSQRIPDWVLERHAAGELPEGFRPEDLARDPTVPERLAALRRSNAEVLERLPADAVAREVRRRAERSAAVPVRPSRRVAGWTVAFAAACLAVLVVPTFARREGDDGLRTKGLSPRLEVYRQAEPGAEVLGPNAATRAGDVLQLRVIGAGERFAAVVSLDGAGTVTLHAPSREGGAVALPPSGLLAMPNAYALDAAPRFERFVLVTAQQPFDVSVVLSAARAVGADPSAPLLLPPGLRQTSFVVRKEESR
ncbi:MAG TPA: ActD-like protein [Myxococcaceae bacterium]|nr:ActD-like protein [Myxococcaceae bacterium]